MRRRDFIRLLRGVAVGSLLAAPVASQAQHAERAFRIGYLSYSSTTGNPHLHEAFRQGLRELGWVEGQNITIDSRFAEGRPGRLADFAAGLVRLRVDVIVAPTTHDTLTTKDTNRTLHIDIQERYLNHYHRYDVFT